MKKITLILILLFPFALSFAQENAEEWQTFQLNDGSFLYGKIIEQDEQLNLVKIQLKSGGEVVVTQETILFAQKNNQNYHLTPKGKFLKTNGSYLLFQTYSLTAKRAETWRAENANRYALGTSFTAGYQFKNAFALGGGFGIDLYEEILMPVFIDVRGNIGKGAVTPFYAFQTGYSFPFGHWTNANEWGEKPKGGFMIYPAVGLKFAGKNKASFQMDVGYNFQNHRREIPNWWDDFDFVNSENVWFKSLALRLGVSF